MKYSDVLHDLFPNGDCDTTNDNDILHVTSTYPCVVDHCHPNPCEHNGVCLKTIEGGFECFCRGDFSGPRCEGLTNCRLTQRRSYLLEAYVHRNSHSSPHTMSYMRASFQATLLRGRESGFEKEPFFVREMGIIIKTRGFPRVSLILFTRIVSQISDDANCLWVMMGLASWVVFYALSPH